VDRRKLLSTIVTTIGSLIVPFRTAQTAPDPDPTSSSQSAPEPLAPVELSGTHAYAEKSVAAGERIQFRISSASPYRLSIVRLGWDVGGPSRDWTIFQFPDRAASAQPIRPGSYVHIPDALPSSALQTVSLECWVRPWRYKWQGLISQYSYPTKCGLGLFLDDGGKPAFYFGDGGAFRPQWLVTSRRSVLQREWTHLAVVFNQGTATLWIDGTPDATAMGPGAVHPGSAPLRLAAHGSSGQTGNCLDGDLAMPAIYERALEADEITARARAKPPVAPSGAGLLGCWPLTEERGQRVADVSAWQRHGHIVNHATWMIGGPGFDAWAIDRFGSYDPATDRSRGHGLRFATEDLFDCQWNVSESYDIPPDLPPGVYVGRILYGADFSHRYDVAFLVRRAESKPQAKILVLCATNTWLAYNVPFPKDPEVADWRDGGHRVSVLNAPGFNMYNNYEHSRAPTYQMGTRMPWSVFPYMTLNSSNLKTPNFGHLVRGERPLHVWLEQNGFDYDVASDLDLHRPNILNNYEIVVINGHSEYWSVQAYDAVDRYLADGGQVVVLSGNTMFWRVSFDPAEEIMECRKLPENVGGRTERVGEIYHSHDGARGGLMREAGYPAWRVLGLECVGFDGSLGSYLVQTPQHPLFRTPEPLGLSKGETLGRGAVGHEYDVRLSEVPGSHRPEPPAGAAPQMLAQAFTDPPGTGVYFDYRANSTTSHGVRSEIIDWQRPAGGRVFGIGSVGASRGVMMDPKLGKLLRNVLHHFGRAHRLNFFAIADDGTVRAKWWDDAAWGPSPSDWMDLGGNFQGAVEAVTWAPDQPAILAIDPSGRLQYKRWVDGSWQPSQTEWVDLAGQFSGRPCAVRWARNRLDIFARGQDGKVYRRAWNGAGSDTSDGWQDLGGAMQGSPAAAVWQGDHLSVAAIGQDHRLKYKWWDGSRWHPSITEWLDLGGHDLAFGPTMTSSGGNRLHVFAVDRAGHLWTKWWDRSAWKPSMTDWTSLGGGVQGAPAVVVRNGFELSVFAVAANGQMHAKWWDGSHWGPSQTEWQNLGGTFAGSPAAAGWRGQYVSVIGRGADGTVKYKSWDGQQWNPPGTDWLDLTGSLAARLRQDPSALAWVGKP
jgi:hypothetical protein